MQKVKCFEYPCQWTVIFIFSKHVPFFLWSLYCKSICNFLNERFVISSLYWCICQCYVYVVQLSFHSMLNKGKRCLHFLIGMIINTLTDGCVNYIYEKKTITALEVLICKSFSMFHFYEFQINNTTLSTYECT